VDPSYKELDMQSNDLMQSFVLCSTKLLLFKRPYFYTHTLSVSAFPDLCPHCTLYRVLPRQETMSRQIGWKLELQKYLL
jgi:hypothetical protein